MVEYCNRSIKYAIRLLTVFKNIHHDTYNMKSKGNKYNEITTSNFLFMHLIYLAILNFVRSNYAFR